MLAARGRGAGAPPGKCWHRAARAERPDHGERRSGGASRRTRSIERHATLARDGNQQQARQVVQPKRRGVPPAYPALTERRPCRWTSTAPGKSRASGGRRPLAKAASKARCMRCCVAVLRPAARACLQGRACTFVPTRISTPARRCGHGLGRHPAVSRRHSRRRVLAAITYLPLPDQRWSGAARPCAPRRRPRHDVSRPAGSGASVDGRAKSLWTSTDDITVKEYSAGPATPNPAIRGHREGKPRNLAVRISAPLAVIRPSDAVLKAYDLGRAVAPTLQHEGSMHPDAARTADEAVKGDRLKSGLRRRRSRRTLRTRWSNGSLWPRRTHWPHRPRWSDAGTQEQRSAKGGEDRELHSTPPDKTRKYHINRPTVG